MTRYERAKRIATEKRFIKSNILASKGEGFRYIRYRICRPLLKIYTHILRSRFKPAPWLTPTSIKIFDTILTPEMTGLEYGSGSSTLFLAPRLKNLISIEHHEGWYRKVSQMIADHRLANVDLHLIPEGSEVDNPEMELPDQFVYKTNYSDYFNKVLDYPDEYFDFALIDGRARVECLINTLPKLKPGAILALDNSERERYQPVFRILSNWKCIQTTNGLTDTTIWFKP